MQTSPPASSSSPPPESHPLDAKFTYLSISHHPSLPFVTIVTLNRPEKRNAINAQMWREIGEAFGTLGTTGDGCRCALLTGSGRAFCGGIDVSDERFFAGLVVDDALPDAARASLAFAPQVARMQAAFTALERCPVPVVAAIHGACLGAGVDLACCADVRVCGPDATFGVREVRLGLAADVGTLQRLPKLVGCGSRVRELCLTGGEWRARAFWPGAGDARSRDPSRPLLRRVDDFSADDALNMGFVSRVSGASGASHEDDLMTVASDICRRISRNGPVAVAVTKASLNYSRDHTVADGLQHIALQNSSALMSEDLAKAFAISGGAEDVRFAPLRAHSRL